MNRAALSTHELIERLIAFDTTSRNSNLELISFIADYLDALGVRSQLTYNDERTKANLFATIGDEDVPGIVLSGHTDVVPVDNQDWHSDPWRVIEKEEKIFGRGACDMKGFIAVCLALAPDMTKRKLKQPVHFAFSYDEEIGCLGVRKLIAALNQREMKPAGCIIGEPTSMQVMTGHKGTLSKRCHVRGLESHSGLPHLGVNAVETAAEMVAFLKRMARRLREQGPFTHGYEPAYSTVHTGVLRGGSVLNIVPAECFFDFEFRHAHGQDPEALFSELRDYVARELLPEMRTVNAKCDIYFEPLAQYPALDTSPEESIVRMTLAFGNEHSDVYNDDTRNKNSDGKVNDVARDKVNDQTKESSARTARTGRASFGTEAGLFAASGMPAVVCGPGSIKQAHKPDEFITLSEIARCEAFIGDLVQRLSV